MNKGLFISPEKVYTTLECYKKNVHLPQIGNNYKDTILNNDRLGDCFSLFFSTVPWCGSLNGNDPHALYLNV